MEILESSNSNRLLIRAKEDSLIDTTVGRRGIAVIDDVAALKQAMEEMDAQDPVAAHTGRDRAAQILGRNKLSFAKMAELIEARRLLLRPRIVANIRRMDQPEMLGDAAFRDAGSALRNEGQSFRKIAEAIELNGNSAPGSEDPRRKREPWHEIANDPRATRWVRAANVALRILFYPLRHPIRSLTIALLATVLGNDLRGVTVSRQISGFVDGVSGARQRTDSAVSSVFGKKTTPQSEEAAAPPTPPAPIPPAPAASPPPSSAPSPAAPTVASAPPAPPPAAAPAAPPAPTSRPDARGTTARSTANDRPQMAHPRVFGGLMPAELRRSSASAGRCIGGTGGCYWGGRQY